MKLSEDQQKMRGYRLARTVWHLALAISLIIISFGVQPYRSRVMAGTAACGRFVFDGSRILFVSAELSGVMGSTGVFLWQGTLSDWETDQGVNIPTDNDFYYVGNLSLLQGGNVVDIPPLTTKLGTVTKAIVGNHPIRKDSMCRPAVTPTPKPTATSTSTPTATSTSTATATPTSTATATFTPTVKEMREAAVSTETPFLVVSETPRLGPLVTPTPTQRSPGLFTVQTPKDAIALTLLLGGTCLAVASVFARLVRSTFVRAIGFVSPFGQKFIIAKLPSEISEKGGLQTVVNLPAEKEWPSRRIYFAIQVGNQEQLGTSVWESEPRWRHHITLHHSMLPMQVAAELQIGDCSGSAWGEYCNKGLALPLNVPGPSSSNYSVRLSLHFEPINREFEKLRLECPKELYFDSSVVVKQFLAWTSTQINIFNTVVGILGLLLALFGFVMKSP